MKLIFKLLPEIWPNVFSGGKSVHWWLIIGYLEKEVSKSEIDIPEATENPDAPAPREMIDLEVCF